MNLDILAVQIALAGLLFFTLNWIGAKSGSLGYISLGMIPKRDEAPAFNLIFRAIGPVVYLVLAYGILKWAGLDRYADNSWLIVALYFAGRLLFTICFGRFLLVNWQREALLWVLSIGLGWWVYEYILSMNQSLLPSVTDLLNNMWVLIFLFLYAAFNNVRFDSDATLRRKRNYLFDAWTYNKLQYGHIISDSAPDKICESLIYAVLIYENFNRPKVVRVVEQAVFPWASKTLGPMQVTTDRRVSDSESVRLGVKIICDAYAAATVEAEAAAAKNGKNFQPQVMHMHRYFLTHKVASAYNKDDSYVAEIREVHQALLDEFYPEFNRPLPSMLEYMF